MKKILLVLFVVLSITACNKQKKDDTKIENQNQIVSTKKTDLLTIEGNQIWIRETPSTGKVIMKLDKETKCKIIKKGKKETIKGSTDYWYKIEYKGKQGWVFGSQTNLKLQNQQNDKTLSKKEINLFVSDFFNSYANKKEKLKDFFIDDSLYELYNPGAFVYVTKKNYKDFFENYPFFENISELNSKIIYNKEPVFDMDSFQWKDKGLFVNRISKNDVLSSLIKYEIEQEITDYSQKIINDASKREKNISYKLTITLEDGIIIYFGKINNKIKIIAIDVSTNDA